MLTVVITQMADDKLVVVEFGGDVVAHFSSSEVVRPVYLVHFTGVRKPSTDSVKRKYILIVYFQ